MRKIFLAFLLVFFAAASYSQTGIIRELTGDVTLKPAGSSVFIPAKTGNEVAQNTIVSTGFKSTAIIEVGSTLITVQPLTRLSLAEIRSSQNTENLNVNLQAGRIRVDVKPPAGTRANTTVQTPSATASVRGTVFEMNTLNLDVIEGAVNWKSLNGLSSNVPAGFKGSIDADGNVSNHAENIKNTAVAAPVGAGLSGERVSSSVSPSGSSDRNKSPSDGDVKVNFTWDE